MPLVQKNGQVVEVSADQFPQMSFAEIKSQKLQDLAARRYQAEVGGTTLGNTLIATDRSTQGKITAAYVKASVEPTYTIDSWKAPDKTFSPLDAATIIAIADAIEKHVQDCFSHEAVLTNQVTAATTGSELDAVDIGAGWP